jgi:hypothetical protein
MSRKPFSSRLFAILLFWSAAIPLVAQQPLPGQANQGFGNQGFFGPATGPGQGGQGGAANADFDSLVDLIVSTVEYDTWMENGSGEGEIQPFPTGVYADPEGTLRFSDSALNAVSFKRVPAADLPQKQSDARKSSPLRYVSLPRLERAIARHQTQHKPLPAEMLTLAGLQRIEYVLINPTTKDLILAGPAGDWQLDPAGVIVSADSARPVLRLDDLLTLMRRPGKAAFGCSITPRQQAIALTQEYLNRSAARPIEPSERKGWLTGLRDSLGKQDVEFFGLSPDSHLAMVLLVADYHMKLIGMGLAEGVQGIESYLDTVELQPDGTAPPMAVLRWWFAMAERPIEINTEKNAYKMPTGGVRVLSENELLAARGQRVHTNQSDALNRRFAESFTGAFAEISQKYSIYGELENVFDLALFLSLVDREQLLERAGWQPTLFEDSATLRLPQFGVPREVETVVNHRVIRRKHIIAGISGGVWIDAPARLSTIRRGGRLSDADDRNFHLAKPQAAGSGDRWWWDQ